MNRMRIRNAFDELHEGERRLAKVVAEECGEGDWIEWLHGRNWRGGWVVHTSGDRVKVRGDSGKEYWIHAGRLAGRL